MAARSNPPAEVTELVDMGTSGKPMQKRRWFQCSRGTLFVLLTLLCVEHLSGQTLATIGCP
jgi:hypothetical protein